MLIGPGDIISTGRDIYHLLGRTFGQGVAIPQVIDFNVFDVVTICDINLAVDFARALPRGRSGRFGSRGRGRCLD